MDLFYILLILLLLTRAFGEIASRFNQPMLAGELLAGVVLGVIVGNYSQFFSVLSELSESHVFETITDLGIFFLMLLAGIEMRPRDIVGTAKGASLIALGGMVFPMALGLGLGFLILPDSNWKFSQMLFLGVALSITAVPIAIATLVELKQQRTKMGSTIVSAAVVDDLISLILLAVLVSVLETGGDINVSSLFVLSGQVLLFLVVTALIGHYVFPWVGRLMRHLKVKHIEFSMLLGWAFAFSVFAELLDMHFILGAYAAGLFFSRETISENLHRDVHVQVEAVSLGLFAPIFFASIGMSIDFTALTAAPLLVLGVIVVASIGKLLGSGAVALGVGFSKREALSIGIGMNARGAIELIVASIALKAGVFAQPDPTPPAVEYLYSAVVLMAIITSMTSPIGLRMVLKRYPTENAGETPDD
ncbi:cation:proton antiporter [candidate division GN15 bacterium]|nr:cation:proton antiporter [candidate division GN15 bacterium]